MGTPQTAYKNQHAREHYDMITVKAPKGLKDELKRLVGAGKVNRFILEAIQEKMKKPPAG